MDTYNQIDHPLIMDIYAHMPIPVRNTFQAFLGLGNDVRSALRTQMGDAVRLDEHKQRCLQFLADAQQVCTLTLGCRPS